MLVVLSSQQCSSAVHQCGARTPVPCTSAMHQFTTNVLSVPRRATFYGVGETYELASNLPHLSDGSDLLQAPKQEHQREKPLMTTVAANCTSSKVRLENQICTTYFITTNKQY